MSENSAFKIDHDLLLKPNDAAQWARDAMAARRWELAARRWATLRAAYPDYPPVWIQGAIAHRHGGRHLEAETLLEEARRRFADHPGGWVQGARTALAAGDLKKAEELLEVARARFPDKAPVWLCSSDLAWAQGNVDAALEHNQYARSRFPDDPGGHSQYAEMAMKSGDWETARERWAEVRALFPDWPAGYRRAAEAEENLGRSREARRLRLAEAHGAEWLEELESEETKPISPPQRRDWRNFVDLVWTKARLNLKSEANRNHLRYMWWILDPLLYMAVFYVVFGLLLQRGGEGYVAYLLTGLVPFQWFSKTLNQTATSIVAGKGLMHKVRISPLFFPLVGIVQNSGKQLLVFAMLGIFLVLYGLPPTIHWLALVPIVLVQILLMVVVCCLVAMVIPFIRDLSNLVPTGIQFLMFTSGIFYTVERIPTQWQTLFFSNPVANLLYQYRQVLVENQWPEWSMLSWLTLGLLVGLGVVIRLYRRLEPVFPRVVIE